MNAYQKREAERKKRAHKQRRTRQEQQAFKAELLIRQYEAASEADGNKRTPVYQHGFYYLPNCKLCEQNLRRAITEIWARVHEKEIQTNDN